MPKRVLCLLTDHFEEIEAITPVDLLRRAGVEVVMASMRESIQVVGRSGILIKADSHFASVDPTTFDLLFIPGGPAVKALREDGRAAALAQSFISAGKTVAAICAAPLVLHDAGLLTGKKYTAHDSTYEELTEADPAQEVVTDGLIITSRGAGTALAFGLALVAQLTTPEEAAKVARAIMA
ncbi:4-methyl-5(b-hydroxyethyl)-thiazole monophosphate biosynthesis [Prosthecobacter fusiformis]|uniref:4-methyl-5(B-hydroxyethyl)-thiazole monophosphate biosynthesis n=1 Tax=Prosthecobacter fusiformis TaxID=48464 RepID=A0A4R7RN95_9BACT|nr:DJ-1 family glyoxalase III [Prosthecobacter fusiformis]TDU66479.1 4-methyl-5(b-hydroxyethyl)-thiazole monophosphate biosynthesis [Prosthecobacter fusiformis]